MGLQPSASKTDLLLQCARPWDDSVEVSHEPPRYEARYGSAFHLGMATLLKGGHPDYVACLLKYDCPAGPTETAALESHVEESAKLLTEWLDGDNPWEAKFTIIGVEQSMAYDPWAESLRHCNFEEEGHQYELEPNEIGLTYDLLFKGVIEKHHVTGVLDHKTGKWGDNSTPSRLGQIRTLAVATGAEVLAILDTVPGGFPVVYAEDWWQMGATLEARRNHSNFLREAMSRRGDGSMRPGPECKFCPARGDCPARGVEILTNAAALVDVASAQLVKPKPDGLTLNEQVEMAGRLHLFLGEFEKLAKLGRAELKQVVEELTNLGVEVTRPDGKVLKIGQKTQERISKKSILLALGSEEGEKMLSRLREMKALVETSHPELRAV